MLAQLHLREAQLHLRHSRNFIGRKLTSFAQSASPSDISAIAKDIKRSPHRVRQALQSLNKKWSNIRTRIGKIARAITIVGLIVSVAYALSSGVAILDIVAGLL